MEKRKLGRKGPDLTVLGLGTWAFGGDGWAGSWGRQDDDASIATVYAALDHGVGWIDTAPVYGLGRAESVVGRALAGMSHRPLLATKCGERFDRDGPFISGSAAGVRADCEASLRRLRVDTIDLYQMHHPPSDVPIEETWQAMVDLAAEGKVRYLGLCNVSVEQICRCAALRHIDAVQGSYSLLRRGLEDTVLAHCAEHGIGVLPYGSLGHGFLCEEFDARRLAADDWRRDIRFAEEVERGRAIVAELSAIARTTGATIEQLTIGWVLGHPAVTASPVGARSPEQAAVTFGAVFDHRALVSEALGLTV